MRAALFSIAQGFGLDCFDAPRIGAKSSEPVPAAVRLRPRHVIAARGSRTLPAAYAAARRSDPVRTARARRLVLRAAGQRNAVLRLCQPCRRANQRTCTSRVVPACRVRAGNESRSESRARAQDSRSTLGVVPTCTNRVASLAGADRSMYRQKRLHAPVGVRHVALHRGKLLDEVMTRRQMTHRIGGTGVARKRKGLTAAAAKIEVAPRAAQAGFFHPIGAAKGLKGRRVRPDVGKCMLANRPELQAGD